MAKVKDILEDVKFNEFLGYEIESYNNRPNPGEGLKYKRTPYDGMKDSGIFNIESIRAEFIKVSNRESRLPRAQKDAITGLVLRVAQTVVNFRAKEAEDLKKAEKPIKRAKKKKEPIKEVLPENQ